MNLLFLGIAFWLGGFIHGLAGFGSILVALPVLGLIYGLKTAAPLAMLMALAVNLSLLPGVHRHARWREIAFLMLWSVPGLIVGAFLLKASPEGPLHIALGAALLLFVASRLAGINRTLSATPALQGAAGLTAGLLGGSIGANGPPIIIYVMVRDMAKDAARGTLVGYFLVSGICIVIGHAAFGLTTMEVLRMFAFGLPVLGVGVYMGNRLAGAVGEGLFRRCVLGLVAVLACLELWKGVTG